MAKSMRDSRRLLALLCLASCGFATAAWADIAKFEIDGRIYTKHMYQNDDSQGILSLGNPFWPDKVSGHNGVGTEFELSFRGKVSDYVEAGARVASRFGMRWQDWWESGASDFGGQENTSGDSAGMNRAAYMQLRGSYVQLNLRLPGVDWVRVGSSDFGMFNSWTVGKVRYIDRDNGRGYFASGHFGKHDEFQYHVGIIAMPKLFVGPGWSTGLGDPDLGANAFWSRDWAYAASVRWQPSDETIVRWVADFTQDLETDKADPDAVGSTNPTCLDQLGNPIPGCVIDHAVSMLSRYASWNTTVDIDQTFLDVWRIQGLLALSGQRIDPTLTSNGVALNQGVFPIVYKDTDAFAGTLRITGNDPWGVGLTLQGEYFNIGQDYNAIFGARREADVLLTDGLVGNGGQLPTMNLANEFIDFDDAWVESCIGWHGGTGLATWEKDETRLQAEYTFITYNQHTQGRDVDKVYPTFLFSEGFTDTAVYDYANTLDRGRDPRSVFKRDQDRHTQIAMTNLRQRWPDAHGLELEAKLKYISDVDYRRLNGPGALNDDYYGNIFIARAKLSLPLWDGVKVGVLGQIDHWDEQHRTGTPELGYGNDVTDKQTAAFLTSIYWQGVKISYYLEYIHKFQDREREPDQLWNIVRSKATIEAAW